MLINCFSGRASNKEHRNYVKGHTTDHVTVNNDFDNNMFVLPHAK